MAISYYGTDKTFAKGYQPEQPIAYDHALHAQKTTIGLDCRHCHSFADKSGQANIPSANVCANCHAGDKGQIKKDSPKLAALRDALDNGKPIRWVKVWDAPDYVYFDHSSHINRGVSCVSCHGEVNKMKTVYRAKAHTMGMCIDCHNAPEDHIRPVEFVTDLQWNAKDYLFSEKGAKTLEAVKAWHEQRAAAGKKHIDLNQKSTDGECQKAFGLYLKEKHSIAPKTSCQTCHN